MSRTVILLVSLTSVYLLRKTVEYYRAAKAIGYEFVTLTLFTPLTVYTLSADTFLDMSCFFPPTPQCGI